MTGLLFTGCSIHRFMTGLQGRHFPGADVAVIQGGAGAITWSHKTEQQWHKFTQQVTKESLGQQLHFLYTLPASMAMS